MYAPKKAPFSDEMYFRRQQILWNFIFTEKENRKTEAKVHRHSQNFAFSPHIAIFVRELRVNRRK
jgi:hypothetical protein